MATANVTSKLESGIFSRLSSRAVVILAKIKKRKSDLVTKEKLMVARFKELLSIDPETEKSKKPGTHGSMTVWTYGPRDCPFAVILTHYKKKSSLDLEAECIRLYKETYGDKWRKRWDAFVADVELEDAESLDIDTNVRYKPKE